MLNPSVFTQWNSNLKKKNLKSLFPEQRRTNLTKVTLKDVKLCIISNTLAPLSTLGFIAWLPIQRWDTSPWVIQKPIEVIPSRMISLGFAIERVNWEDTRHGEGDSWWQHLAGGHLVSSAFGSWVSCACIHVCLWDLCFSWSPKLGKKIILYSKRTTGQIFVNSALGVKGIYLTKAY